MSADGAQAEETDVEEPEGEESEGKTPADDSGEAEPPKLTRAEARKARAAEHKELEDLRAWRKTAEENQQAQAQQIAEMRGYLAAQAQQQQEGPDPREEKIKQLRTEARQHLYNAQSARSPEVAEAEFARFQEKTEEAGAIRAHAAIMADVNPRFANQLDPAEQRRVAAMVMEFPWLETNEGAAAMAMAKERELQRNQGGRTPTPAQSRAILADVAKTLGLGGHSNGSPNRAAYSGVPSRQGGGGDGAGRMLINPANLSDSQKKLAQLAYPQFEPAVARKTWAARMNKALAKPEADEE